jgi:hypothetical protein
MHGWLESRTEQGPRDDALEQAVVASLRASTALRIAAVAAAAAAPWVTRRVAANDLLATVNTAWWTRRRDATAYERDRRATSTFTACRRDP